MSDAVLYEAAMPDGIADHHHQPPDEQRNCLSREVREGLRAAWDRFERDDSACASPS
jgi:enoyl-CoA hydratase